MRTPIPRHPGSAEHTLLADAARTVRTIAIVVATIACSISFLVAAAAKAEPRTPAQSAGAPDAVALRR